ncbi:hypothetical protein PV08_09641 [Exophiala spinifera]|uniref:Uncharacterized protein n=1 Tax=Exophiala spinifera TaxID=91928 RepID=A0A0D2BMG6_9EURO|nr:uncharacterized protein PV08_09641 [Exophiala spinifera]KIW12364.1 hypothetical protein PV08_09641 [Exophiala spinifera]
MKPYIDQGPINCDIDIDTNNVKGKTAIVTGGANGIGEAYVRALSKAGAYVLIADVAEGDGERLAQELGRQLLSPATSSVRFVKCDVSSWRDQVAVFKEASSFSPSGRIDIVIPNAGIAAPIDSIFSTNVEDIEPEEPKMKVISINLTGVLYTVKLALHYFRRQNASNTGDDLDQVLILQGSLAGFIAIPRSVEYTTSKWGARGIFRTLRETEFQHNVRVCYIAPTFIHTKFLSDDLVQLLNVSHVEYATVEDAAGAVMRIVTDSSVQGRALAIAPRSLAPRGYLDLCDDNKEGSAVYPLIAESLGKLGLLYRADLPAGKPDM